VVLPQTPPPAYELGIDLLADEELDSPERWRFASAMGQGGRWLGSSALVAVAAVGGTARAHPTVPTHHVPCARVIGMPWKMTIQEKLGLKVVHGHRYEVWNGSLSCDRAGQLVPEMTRARTAPKLRALSFGGMKCRVVREFELRSASAIHSLTPPTARGECDDQARFGKHFRWWPAVPR
jgi:hypothetical protein